MTRGLGIILVAPAVPFVLNGIVGFYTSVTAAR
jgi:hypothetical protein